MFAWSLEYDAWRDKLPEKATPSTKFAFAAGWKSRERLDNREENLITYFVSYLYPDGHGRCSITRKKPITSIKDIEGIEEHLRDSNNITDIIVTGWKRFEEEKK